MTDEIFNQTVEAAARQLCFNRNLDPDEVIQVPLTGGNSGTATQSVHQWRSFITMATDMLTVASVYAKLNYSTTFNNQSFPIHQQTEEINNLSRHTMYDNRPSYFRSGRDTFKSSFGEGLLGRITGGGHYDRFGPVGQELMRNLSEQSPEEREHLGRVARGEDNDDLLRREDVRKLIRSLRTNPVPSAEYQKALGDVQKKVTNLPAYVGSGEDANESG